MSIRRSWDEKWEIRDRFEVKTFFLEITMILEEKYRNTRSIQSEDLFFRDHDYLGEKKEKYEINDLFLFREHQFLGILASGP